MNKLPLIFIFISSVLFSQEFTIATSKGEVDLIIPEDMTLEEAYENMASLYLEERYDLEEALAEIDKLTSEAEEYIEEVNRLEEEVDILQNDNEELQDLYDRETRDEAISILFDIGFGIESDLSYFLSTSFGVQLFDTWYGQIQVSYPIRIGLSLGREF